MHPESSCRGPSTTPPATCAWPTSRAASPRPFAAALVLGPDRSALPLAPRQGTATPGAGDITSDDDTSDIQAVIRRYRGQVKYRYDGRLKENPTLEVLYPFELSR